MVPILVIYNGEELTGIVYVYLILCLNLIDTDELSEFLNEKLSPYKKPLF